MAAQLVQFVKTGARADEVPVLVAHNGRIFDLNSPGELRGTSGSLRLRPGVL